MGDNHHGAILPNFLEICLNNPFRFGIEVGSGFIED
jgi:hypothetical protein